MRLVALVFLVGCVGGGSARPAVMPRLTELPGDPVKRDAVIDSANATPGPEHRKPLPPKMRKAETAAATAAAILGEMFSTTKNVTLGTGGAFDENVLVEDKPPVPATQPENSEATHDTDYTSGALVPWVKLPAQTAPAPGT
jgi:hypothetical protein